MRSSFSGRIPTPVSWITNRTSSWPGTTASSTHPSSVNLIALDSRLTSTCLALPTSVSMSTGGAAVATANPRPFATAMGSMTAAASRASSFASIRSIRTSSPPCSMRAKLRISSISCSRCRALARMRATWRRWRAVMGPEISASSRSE